MDERWAGAILGVALVGVVPVELTSESMVLNTYYPSPLGIYTQMTTTNNTILARDGGQVGIATIAPSHQLDIAGNTSEILRLNSTAGNQSQLDFATAGSNKWALYVPSGGTDLAVWNYQHPNNPLWLDGTAAGNVYLAPFAGAVGVGTNAPQQNLSVGAGAVLDQSNQNNGFLNQNGAQGNGLSLGSGSGEGVASKRTAGGNQYGLDFYTGFQPRLRITNAGETQVLGNLKLGGVSKGSWPAPFVNQRWSAATQGRHWFSASVSCNAGEVLAGCSGYYTQVCSPGSPNGIEDVCSYNGSYPSGNSCVAWAYEGNNQGHGNLSSIATCLYLSP